MTCQDPAGGLPDTENEATQCRLGALGRSGPDSAPAMANGVAAITTLGLFLISISLLHLSGPSTIPTFAKLVSHTTATGPHPYTHIGGAPLSRRKAMAGFFTATAGFTNIQRARATDGTRGEMAITQVALGRAEFVEFYGVANSPAKYEGLGGGVKEDAMYSYIMDKEVWSEAPVGPIDHRLLGIESRFLAPSKRRAFCVSRIQSGDSNRGFLSSQEPRAMLRSIADAEPPSRPGRFQGDLADAMDDGFLSYEPVMVQGVPFYDFEVSQTATHWLVRVGLFKDRLYAFFVTAPEAAFQADQESLARIFRSFTVYDRKFA